MCLLCYRNQGRRTNVNITITAEVVAWYGAVVGTGSLVVSGLGAWRDRARIVVTARPGYKALNAPGYSPDKLYAMALSQIAVGGP